MKWPWVSRKQYDDLVQEALTHAFWNPHGCVPAPATDVRHDAWDAQCSRNVVGEATRPSARCPVCRPLGMATPSS